MAKLNLIALNDLLRLAKKSADKKDLDSARGFLGLLASRASEMAGNVLAVSPTPGRKGKEIGVASEDRMTSNEVAAMDELNRRNTVDERAKCHARILPLVMKAFQSGVWNGDGKLSVTVPISWGSVSEIEPYLKANGVHFSDLQKGLYPAESPKYWALTFTR